MRKSIIRRAPRSREIPMASTADIAFLLILFFMVTTVFRATVLPLVISLPKARSTERILLRRHICYIFVDTNSKIYIDDMQIPSDLIAGKIAQRVWDDPELNTHLNVDESVNYGTVDAILDQLKEAKAYRITFATKFKE